MVTLRRRHSQTAAALILISALAVAASWAGASQNEDDEARAGRALLAECKRDFDGQLRCESSVGGRPSGNPPPNNNWPPLRPNPGFPRSPGFPDNSGFPINPGFPNNPGFPAFPGGGGMVDFRGCMAERPRGGQDQQTAARQLLNALMSASGCGFLPANFLRIAFHDSGTFSTSKRGEGANGSIRLEVAEPANQAGGQIPRTLDIISDVQSQLQAVGINLSFADLVQLAAAEAVAIAGGPRYSVPLGRVDSNRRDTYNTFPDPNDNIMVLLNKFGGMGLSVRDFVALSGAHTIGSQTRSTPGRFDNRHFQEILARRAPLPSDNALMDNPATRSWVQAFANSEGEFFQAFAAAMLQVANMGANFGFMG